MIKKSSIIGICTLFILFQIALPLMTVNAQATQPQQPKNFLNVVPCGNGRTADAAKECNLAYFVTMIQNIINVLVILSFPATMIVLTWVGILLLTSAGNENKITQAKTIAYRVIIGFIVILTAWLVVQIIFMAITGKNFND